MQIKNKEIIIMWEMLENFEYLDQIYSTNDIHFQRLSKIIPKIIPDF